MPWSLRSRLVWQAAGYTEGGPLRGVSRDLVMVRVVRILFVADTMGSPGRRALSGLLGTLRSRLKPDFVVVNGENAAGGLGITKPTGRALLDTGIDVITLGNHSFAKRDALEYVNEEPRVLRPANYPPGVPGRGWGVFSTGTGEKAAVVSLLGRTFMTPVDCPFRAADAILAEIDGETPIVVVDIHAEATSEKLALAWHLEGRASAVLGTHTHVQTSDERVMPAGTAYITDAGMTGVVESVLGLEKTSVVERFMTQVMGRFVLAEGEATLQGAIVEVDSATGRALSIERVSVRESEAGC